MTLAKFTPWLQQVNETLPAFVDTLALPEQTGRYIPCLNGATEAGRSISLGFSTFAVRILYVLNRLEEMPKSQQTAWADFLRGFQVEDCRAWGGGAKDNAFVDVPQIQYLREIEKLQPPKRKSLFDLFKKKHPNRTPPKPSPASVMMSESRQALATLSLMSEQPNAVYTNFPMTVNKVVNYLQSQNWSTPWSAGARTAVLSFLLANQGSRVVDKAQFDDLKKTILQFLDGVVDKETGAYFMGDAPSYDQLVNGSHKVLTALEWLDAPIHFPERVVDTILARLPSPEGCHLVDVVYPLFRCGLQVNYRRDDVINYCAQLLDMVTQHSNQDGGFSYFVNKSQTSYYGLQVASGLPESDLHGSLLLIWALSMLVAMLDINHHGWKPFQP